ncbi:MAG: ribosome assembly cofactor RimP [Sphingobacteriales bacterium]|jgi:ribosome maturation factor RimP
MSKSLQIVQIEEMLAAVMEGQDDLFVVDVKIKPTNNVKIFIDGDQGVSIDKCVKINRQLYKRIEEVAIWPEGDFSLEVSSPGIGEPLKLMRQYKKNIGRIVEVVKVDESKLQGKLLSADDETISLEETKGKNKKKEVIVHTISFDQIKTTIVQVTF